MIIEIGPHSALINGNTNLSSYYVTVAVGHEFNTTFILPLSTPPPPPLPPPHPSLPTPPPRPNKNRGEVAPNHLCTCAFVDELIAALSKESFPHC